MKAKDLMEIDVAKVPSAVLRRLIEEIKDERNLENQPQLYDRVHNRHNRGNGGGRYRPQPMPEPTPTPTPTPTPEPEKA